jgi:hypothetical protein
LFKAAAAAADGLEAGGSEAVGLKPRMTILI